MKMADIKCGSGAVLDDESVCRYNRLKCMGCVTAGFSVCAIAGGQISFSDNFCYKRFNFKFYNFYQRF